MIPGARPAAGAGTTPPRLLPLALRLLGPMLVLAVLAAIALLRDWRSARAEAMARAAEIAHASAGRLIAALDAWKDRDPPATVPGVRVVDWFRIGSSNELLEPGVLPWPPQPAPAPTLADPEQEALWRQARRSLESGQWAPAAAQYESLVSSFRSSTNAPATNASRRVRALALFEGALARERAGQTNGLADALAEVVEAATPAGEMLTDAGIPISHLAALRILESAAGRPESLPARWRHEPGCIAALSRDPGSPYLTAFFERLRPLVPKLEPEALRVGWQKLESDLERATRSRLRHAAARRSHPGPDPWPPAFWIDSSVPGWLAVNQDLSGAAVPVEPPAGSRLFVLLHESWIDETLQSTLQQLDSRGEFVVRAALADRNLALTTRELSHLRAVERDPQQHELTTLHLGTSGGAPVVIGVSFVDPAAYFSTQRRRVLFFGGLMLVALAAAAFSVHATHRALLRQYELGIQKSNFVSSVSHELRAPLGSIRLLAEGLERGSVVEESRRHEYYRLIGQETRRLGALVENVLDFSRIEQGRKRYEFEVVDLRALVLGTARLFEPLAAEQGVRIDVKLPPSQGPLEVQADGRAVQQALLNLIDNALKHSATGAVIEVGLSAAAPGDVAVTVADSGPGIPKEEQELIFEAFYRRGSELRRDTQGVGIGLSLVRHIMDAHDGRVTVDSHPGAGARFSLVLPASRVLKPSG